MTLENVRRAASLDKARQELIEQAVRLCDHEASITISAEMKQDVLAGRTRPLETTLAVERQLERLRSLIRDEIAGRIAVIDAELRSLGIDVEPAQL